MGGSENANTPDPSSQRCSCKAQERRTPWWNASGCNAADALWGRRRQRGGVFRYTLGVVGLVEIHFQPLLPADENRTGLGALIGTDDSLLFHLVHDAGGPGIAQFA